ncbi:MAG TPA: helix-turn-helix domain-containing protein [Thermoplasmata archaeon]|jgi:DNA-binding HxlR family transcriptional regulator|nr:helix-turn-helix domain-containing protein [Thermoplasmata archaeon]
MGESSVPYPAPPEVPIEACPIATTLQTLGRKWTITILRDVAFFPKATFGLIRKRNPGLRQRTLSIRLAQLQAEDLIRKAAPPGEPRRPYYELTTKGLEIWPILATLFQYGTRHHAETVFADGRPRDLQEIYPHDAPLLLGPVAAFARTAVGVSNRAVGAARSAGAESSRASRR